MTADSEVRSLLSDAYQGERFTMTLSEIQERATGRRRRRWVPALATGLAVIVAGTTWQLIPQRVTDLLTADATFTHQCLAGWKPTNEIDDVPAERFRFGTPENGLRIYTRGDILVECIRENGVTTVGTLYALLTSSPGMDYFAHHGTRGKPSYLVGEVPAEMTRVVAELSNGDTLPAVISGNRFAIWHASASLVGARIKTSDKDRSGPIATSPSQPGSIYNQAAFDSACRKKDDEALDLITRPDSTIPSLLYATRSGYVTCSFESTPESTSFGLTGVGPKNKRPWIDAEALEHYISSKGDDYALVGRAPDGATDIKIEMLDGTILKVSRHGILFFATWSAPGSLLKTKKITAIAGDKTYVYENDKTTVR